VTDTILSTNLWKTCVLYVANHALFCQIIDIGKFNLVNSLQYKELDVLIIRFIPLFA